MIHNRLPQIKREDLVSEVMAKFIFHYQAGKNEKSVDVAIYAFDGVPEIADQSLKAAETLFFLDQNPRKLWARRQAEDLGFGEICVLTMRDIPEQAFKGIIEDMFSESSVNYLFVRLL